MNEKFLKIFYYHYKSEMEEFNRRLVAHEPILSIEDFDAKCETDKEFKKKNVYLFHPSLHTKDEDFLQMIDFLGGWPSTAKSVVLRHGDNRSCYFSLDENIRNEWNTSILTADDYYWWKLSDSKREEFKKKIYNEIGYSIISRSR